MGLKDCFTSKNGYKPRVIECLIIQNYFLLNNEKRWERCVCKFVERAPLDSFFLWILWTVSFNDCKLKNNTSCSFKI